MGWRMQWLPAATHCGAWRHQPLQSHVDRHGAVHLVVMFHILANHAQLRSPQKARTTDFHGILWGDGCVSRIAKLKRLLQRGHHIILRGRSDWSRTCTSRRGAQCILRLRHVVEEFRVCANLQRWPEAEILCGHLVYRRNDDRLDLCITSDRLVDHRRHRTLFRRWWCWHLHHGVLCCCHARTKRHSCDCCCKTLHVSNPL